jgi:hypothetical protein
LHLLSQFFCGGTAFKVMGVYYLAMAQILYFHEQGYFIPDKIMEAGNADPGFSFMFVFIIITYLIKIVAIIEYADTD